LDATRTYFEQIAARWEEPSPERLLNLERLAKQLSGVLPASGRWLEVGTGTGIFIPYLFRHHADMRLVSLDLAFNMLQRASQRKTSAMLNQADVRNLPYPDGCFSLVICHNSFPHFGDYPVALQELKRVATIGGKVVIAHDIGRERVNAVHLHSHAGFIHHHLLPTGQEMMAFFNQAGMGSVNVIDNQEYFLAYAERI